MNTTANTTKTYRANLDMARHEALRARLATIDALLHRLQRPGSGIRAKLQGEGLETRVVFEGGASGSASLLLEASSDERIEAHFAGYCEANGCLKPRVGAKVLFRSASSPSGWRSGTITKVMETRAEVAFFYTYQVRAAAKRGERPSTPSTTKVRFEHIRFAAKAQA